MIFPPFYLFLAALGLHCCVRTFSNCDVGWYSLVAGRGFLTELASLVAEHRLQAHRALVVVVLGLGCSRHVGSSQSRDQTCVPCIGR